MSEFIKIARLSEVPVKRSRLVKVNDLDIALWNVDGCIYAINNICPHQHFSMLHQGTLEGTYVTCPMHGHSFSLKDGTSKDNDGRAKTYEVKVDQDSILLKLDPADDS